MAAKWSVSTVAKFVGSPESGAEVAGLAIHGAVG